jgi:starch-binding outer membrane protein, SusD/RagB family
MKTIYKTITKLLVVLLLSIISTISCEEYLDKAPEVNITENEVFSKFSNFQGFMENAYQCIVDHSTGMKGVSNWNFGDDIICGAQSIFCSPEFDRGNYFFWEDINASPFYGNIASVTSGSDKGYWQSGWYGIRLSNLALANVNKLTSGAQAQEERNLISGQAYFFRGYFHFEIIRSWGGVPYITTAFNPADALRFPRLTYRQCADSITADLQKAAALLPVSWDETQTGQVTAPNNKGRLTKGAAYGYLGKNLLYAASPLMNGVGTGSYTYDVELCKQAAVAFYEVIKLANQYPQYIGLETWADYSKNFYSLTTDVPNGKEIIFSNPINAAKPNGNHGGEQVIGAWGFAAYNGPSENYVENFGMANGLPITAAGSGYDPGNPWVNRDPRFYYSIILDGERIILNTENADTYFQSYVGGRHRNTTDTRSGYGNKKFKHITCNPYDRGWTTYYWEVPHMRLADIYLMYAEAVNEAYGPAGSAPGGPTAVQAINIIRTRAGVPDVDAQFLTKDLFREIIRQERAVELCMEGHRWYDIRRWYVAHLPQFREKYALDFDADHTYFNKRLWGTTVFEDKHYWLPFNVEQATLYAGFPQNPGW